jgi:seryl-tRNA synthetase
MRKFTNKEANDVAELVAINKQIREMQRELKTLNDQQKEKREELRSVIAKHGEAHNAQHIVTVSKQTRKGYEVKPSTFEKFNIAER